ncbi:hypothetical protein [Methanobacterium formicicum]
MKIRDINRKIIKPIVDPINKNADHQVTMRKIQFICRNPKIKK